VGGRSMAADILAAPPVSPVAAGGLILDPDADFTPRERDAYLAARVKDFLVLADINAAARRLHALYASRKLGCGKDPAWKVAVEECRNLLDDLYATRRATLARMSVVLASALRRRRREGRRGARPAVLASGGRGTACES